jgi:hypothetical protein
MKYDEVKILNKHIEQVETDNEQLRAENERLREEVADVRSVLERAYTALDHMGLSKITREYAMQEIERVREGE